MIDRFRGKEGSRRLLAVIRDCRLVGGHDDLAAEVVRHAKLFEFAAGDTLIQQGDHDNHLFVIVAGEVDVLVNKRWMQSRTVGRHVGELALIDPSQPRSASIVAKEVTVAAKVHEPKFSEWALKWPHLWRSVALDVACRLRQRNDHVSVPNEKPVIFIGSSSEGLKFAEPLKKALEQSVVVPQIWTDNFFTPGHGTMEDLEEKIQRSDFGVLVFSPDDRIRNAARKVDAFGPRDNVLVEFGLCTGALGRKRTFAVFAKQANVKIPTDLAGITLIPVDWTARAVKAEVASTKRAICRVVKSMGVK